ncbi:MAG: hypothetical protein LZF62_440093 [Nitrospira sp.]|nr:MAG: hypothetical protein LZF62_440093 [Nitrospira sp.]
MPSPAKVGVTQPPQITAGGVSTSRNRCPAPAASPALCSSAPTGVAMAMTTITLAQSASFPSPCMSILVALLVRNDVTVTRPDGLAGKKKRPSGPTVGPKGRHCPLPMWCLREVRTSLS